MFMASMLLTLDGVVDVRYLSQNLTLQELFASNDEQVTVACQVSGSILRRIVSYCVIVIL